jgi:hypothetical protein
MHEALKNYSVKRMGRVASEDDNFYEIYQRTRIAPTEAENLIFNDMLCCSQPIALQQTIRIGEEIIHFHNRYRSLNRDGFEHLYRAGFSNAVRRPVQAMLDRLSTN